MFSFHLKYILFYLLLPVIFWSSFAHNEQPDIVLDYTIVAFDIENDEMQVIFELTNATNHHFSAHEWSLHWNQIIGKIKPQSLPNGIDFEWVNGNSYFVLKFGSEWNLKAGEKIKFQVTKQGIMSRLALGPTGVFIVQNETPYDITTNVHWKNARGVEYLNLPTARSRFHKFEHISRLSKESLKWVLPTPAKFTASTDYRKKEKDWRIFLHETLLDKKEIITSLVKSSGRTISWVAEIEDANVIIKTHSILPDEGYRIKIEENNINLYVSSHGGLVYALHSLLQVDTISDLEKTGWPLVEVQDSPRFLYRGFLLDIARNFYGSSKIKQIIDLMSMFKLNHLDLKLSDDEGWRLQIPDLPELTEIGATRGYTTNEEDRLIPMYGSGATGKENGNGFLTSNEFIELIRYAHLRNITIIPQISFPSHARAAIKSMESRRIKFEKEGNYKAAQMYNLSDPNDKSTYLSAQLYNDNTINICLESSYSFFEKVVDEVAQMYRTANVPLKQFSIGADELPYGVWQESPRCDEKMSENKTTNSLSKLYNTSIFRLKNIIEKHGAVMSGWEDFLLEHSKNSQSETTIKAERFNYEVIPYVWNNTWGGGREDMIYKFANLGYKTVMSNSSAFYFDMANDADMSAHGLHWSGYVDYFDAWAIDPEDIFANKVLNEKHNISAQYIEQTVKLHPQKRNNLLGIQSQLWGETVRNENILDAMLLPNLIVFAERAWASRPDWISFETDLQKSKMFEDWNLFLNVLSQRTLPLLSEKFPTINYDLPKPGGIIKNNTLVVRSLFPGLDVRYTLDGSIPNSSAKIYKQPVPVSHRDNVVLRTFDSAKRGGNFTTVKRE